MKSVIQAVNLHEPFHFSYHLVLDSVAKQRRNAAIKRAQLFLYVFEIGPCDFAILEANPKV